MMRTKFFLMMLAAIVMGSQVTLFAQEKKGAKSERRQFNKEQNDVENNSANQINKRIGIGMTQRLLNLFRCINNTWKKCGLLVIWEPVEILQIERLQINRPPNRFLQMLKWSRLSRHVSRRVERYWMFVRSIIMSSGNFFLLNKFRKCIIWRNTMAINSVKR